MDGEHYMHTGVSGNGRVFAKCKCGGTFIEEAALEHMEQTGAWMASKRNAPEFERLAAARAEGVEV